MPSVIDELIVKISFDIQDLKKSSAAADGQLKKLRENAEVTGKEMEASGKRAAGFFAAAKVEAISLMAVLTGGAGLITALAGTASGMADLGRAAASLNGMDPARLDAWGQALKRIGGSADDAVQSFNNIGAALARQKLMGGSGGIMPFLNAIGAQRTMTPEQVALKFSEYIKAHPEKTNQELNVIGGGLGMSQSLINLLRTGPAAVAKELELSKQLGLRTADMIKTAEKFQHDWEALNQAARHVTDKLMTGLMPTMDKVIVALTNWIVENPTGAEAGAVVGTVLGGSIGTSVIARLLGLTALSNAFGVLTGYILRLNAVLAFLGLTGPAGGQATQAETDAHTKLLQDAGILPKPDGSVTPRTGPGFLDPNSGPSAWDWIKGKLGFAPSTTTPPPTRRLPGPRADAVPPATPPGSLTGSDIQAFIMHHTGGRGTVAGVQNTLRQRGLGVEYIMDRDGKITVAGGRGSKHIMPGWGPKGEGLNNGNTVGMEIIANDDADVTPAQIAAARAFIAKYYPGTRVLGHGEVNPGHKQATEGKTVVDAINADRGRRAGPRIDKLPSAALPGLHSLIPSAGERERDPEFRSSNTTNSTDIGHITIHTAATNAHGIAKELHGAISDKLIRDSNRGLV